MSVAIIAYLYIPGYRTDLAKWYLIFYNIKNGDFSNYTNWLSSSPDFFIYTYIYALTRLGLNKELIPFFSVMVSYFLYLYIVIKEVKVSNFTRSFSSLLILYFIFTLDFRTITLGVRQGLAISIFIFSIYRHLFNKKDFLSYIMIIIAINIHFMIIVPVFAYILSLYIKVKYQRIILFISLLVLVLPIDNIMLTVIKNFIPYLSGNNERILETYTTGYWGQEYSDDLSFKGKVQVLLSTLPYFMTLFFMLLYRCRSEISKFTSLMIFVVSLFSFSDTLFIRYSVVVTMLLPLLLMMELNKNRMNFLFYTVKFFSCITFFIFVSVFYSARNELAFTLENYVLANIFNIINYNSVPF